MLLKIEREKRRKYKSEMKIIEKKKKKETQINENITDIYTLYEKYIFIENTIWTFYIDLNIKDQIEN